jgi:glycosyltransferase involved in cell wall biosynthesis
LIKEKDSDSIKTNILKLFDSNDFSKINAREIIKNKFSWEIISEKYFNLLK